MFGQLAYIMEVGTNWVPLWTTIQKAAKARETESAEMQDSLVQYTTIPKGVHNINTSLAQNTKFSLLSLLSER